MGFSFVWAAVANPNLATKPNPGYKDKLAIIFLPRVIFQVPMKTGECKLMDSPFLDTTLQQLMPKSLLLSYFLLLRLNSQPHFKAGLSSYQMHLWDESSLTTGYRCYIPSSFGCTIYHWNTPFIILFELQAIWFRKFVFF